MTGKMPWPSVKAKSRIVGKYLICTSDTTKVAILVETMGGSGSLTLSGVCGNHS